MRRLHRKLAARGTDAQTYSKWGFDYLKYDWCSYGDIALQEVTM